MEMLLCRDAKLRVNGEAPNPDVLPLRVLLDRRLRRLVLCMAMLTGERCCCQCLISNPAGCEVECVHNPLAYQVAVIILSAESPTLRVAWAQKGYPAAETHPPRVRQNQITGFLSSRPPPDRFGTPFPSAPHPRRTKLRRTDARYRSP